MKSNRGFTLIELVVVIVILGILAATALPKFVDLGQDARTAAMKGLQGAMQATNTMIYAKASVQSTPKLTGNATIQINGTDIGITYGYAKDITELKKLMDASSEDFDFTTNAATNKVVHKKAPSSTKCTIVYTPATPTAAPTYNGTGTDTTCGS